MVQPKEGQLGTITVLDEDTSGYVNASGAIINNVDGIVNNNRATSPGNNSFWTLSGSPTKPVFTDSAGTDILLGALPTGGSDLQVVTQIGSVAQWISLDSGDLFWDGYSLRVDQVTNTDGYNIDFGTINVNEFLFYDGSSFTTQEVIQTPVPTVVLETAADFDNQFAVVSNRYQVTEGVYWIAADNINLGNRGFDCFGSVVFMGGGSSAEGAVGTGNDPRTTLSSSFQTTMFRANNATVQLHNFNMKCTTSSGSNGMFSTLGGGRFFVNNMSFIADDASSAPVITVIPEMYAVNCYFYGGWNAVASGSSKFINCKFESNDANNDFEITSNSISNTKFISCQFNPSSAIVIDGSSSGSPISELTFNDCTFSRPSLNDPVESFIEFAGSADRWASIKFIECKVNTTGGDSIWLDFTGQSNPTRHLSVKGTIAQHSSLDTFTFFTGISDPHVIDNWIFSDNYIQGSSSTVPFNRVENSPELELPTEITSTPANLEDPYGRHAHIRVNIASPSDINLPASPITGSTYTVKDSSGAASSNNITISGSGNNIDGSASFIIDTDYGFVTVQYDGTEWFIVSDIGAGGGTTVSPVPQFSAVLVSNSTIADTTSAIHRVVPVDTSATGSNAPLTINLPSTPLEGERITIKDYGGASDTNNITVGRNGNNIDNNASNDFLADSQLAVTYTWSGVLNTWIII